METVVIPISWFGEQERAESAWRSVSSHSEFYSRLGMKNLFISSDSLSSTEISHRPLNFFEYERKTFIFLTSQKDKSLHIGHTTPELRIEKCRSRSGKVARGSDGGA